MSRRRCQPLAVVPLLVPTLVAAQGAVSAGPYAAYPLTESASGASPRGMTVGVQTTFSGGAVAARVGAGTSLRGDDDLAGASGTRTDGWSADGDLLLFPQAFGRRTRAGTPLLYGLAGLGVSSRSDATLGGSNATATTWSYGAGLLVPLGTLELSAETRTRTPLATGGARSSGGAWYEGRVGVALRFGGASSASTRAGRSPNGSPRGGASGGASGVGVGSAARVLPTAERYLGVPYRWGGTSPTTGFDCSGFTQYVFARNGLELPRTSRQQAQVGLALSASWDALGPGDLVMFAEPGEAISHVAIYAGQRRIIHASSSGGGVRYDDLDTRRGQWYVQRMVAARRITTDGRGLVRGLVEALRMTNVPLDPPDHAPRP